MGPAAFRLKRRLGKNRRLNIQGLSYLDWTLSVGLSVRRFFLRRLDYLHAIACCAFRVKVAQTLCHRANVAIADLAIIDLCDSG